MRPSLDWKAACGALAVLGWLLLASPGVRLVRAEDGPQSRVPVTTHGPSCPAQAQAAEVVELETRLAELQRRLDAEREAGPTSGSDVPVALNNRGYNDGPPPAVDIGQVLHEAATTP